MKLLIVDDRAEMREMIRATVCTPSDVVQECDDGAEAVDVFLNFKPDYVLMDIQMKKVDGLVALARIRERDKNAHVIIVTNYDNASFRNAAREAGAEGYVLKENLQELHQLMHH